MSDAQRDRVIAELKDGYAEGRLSRDTFGHRVDAVLGARFGDELRGVVADLRAPRRFGAAMAAIGRRALQATDHWLRGSPAVLWLPSGTQDRYTIGRELACDMTLAHMTVSRWHASLRRDGNGWLIDDLGSTNGTCVNGWRVRSPSRVHAGDLVSFGTATFVLADRPR